MEDVKSKIEIIKGDITKISVDAIVNAANRSLLGGGGVDGAIHRAGGAQILEECKKIILKQGGCKTGEAVITTAGKLNAKFVIHTVGPIWRGGKDNENILLQSCYKNSIKLANKEHCTAMAFPCISTGVYGYPIPEAANIQINTIFDCLQKCEHVQKVIIVCFDEINFYHLSNELN